MIPSLIFRPVTEGGGWCAHARILGLPQDLYFKARDGGASESTARLP